MISHSLFFSDSVEILQEQKCYHDSEFNYVKVEITKDGNKTVLDLIPKAEIKLLEYLKSNKVDINENLYYILKNYGDHCYTEGKNDEAYGYVR